MVSEEPGFGEGGELRLILLYLKFDVFKKKKGKKQQKTHTQNPPKKPKQKNPPPKKTIQENY